MVVLSHPVCDNLLQQPQETSTLCTVFIPILTRVLSYIFTKWNHITHILYTIKWASGSLEKRGHGQAACTFRKEVRGYNKLSALKLPCVPLLHLASSSYLSSVETEAERH